MLAPFFSSQAAVTVVDAAAPQQSSQKPAKPEANPNAQLLYQLQLLQDEMMRMRGMLEEQQHQILQLKQQRLDDYVNLDKRLTELSQQLEQGGSKPASVIAPVSAAPVSAISAPATAASAPVSKGDAGSEFNAAYALIKEKQFSQSLQAFEAFVQKYPATEYTPNAYYWIGKLLFIESRYDDSKKAFATVVEQYPEHDKAPGSLYKMAEINYEQGNRDVAKQQMQLLVERYADSPSKVVTNIVRNAREFLNKHYP